MMRRSATAGSSAVLLFLTVTACSSSVESPTGSVASASSFANAYCARFERCSPFGLQATYGDLAFCEQTINDRTGRVLAAKGASATQAQIDRCADAMRTSSCETETSPDCILKGTLPDAAGCLYDAQCASGSCFLPFVGDERAECGTCTPPAGEGGDCEVANCEPGLYCIDGTCRRGVAGDSACDETKICLGARVCVDGTCQPLIAEGSVCQFGDDAVPCDITQGAVCVPDDAEATTASCKKIGLAEQGQACGVDRTALTITDCKRGTCSNLTSGGTCVPYAAEGESCTDIFCEPSLDCVAGVCRKLDPGACN